MFVGGSGLRIAPDDVADRYLPRNQPELEEAIGHALLGRNDIFGDRTHGKRGAVGGDGLDVERDAGDGTEGFGDFVAMGLWPGWETIPSGCCTPIISATKTAVRNSSSCTAAETCCGRAPMSAARRCSMDGSMSGKR